LAHSSTHARGTERRAETRYRGGAQEDCGDGRSRHRDDRDLSPQLDCADDARAVEQALAKVPGIQLVSVSLAVQKAVIQFDARRASRSIIEKALEATSCCAPAAPHDGRANQVGGFTRQVLTLFGIVFGAVLFVVVVVGEWLGIFETLTTRVPWPFGVALVLIGGYPVFRNVVRAALRRQGTSHTLMTLGTIAALAVGEWATAAIVVFFMRVGDYVERFTTERARRAVKGLTAMAPQMARVERDGVEREVPVGTVTAGDSVIVRPGEKVPVDGEVVSGHATVDQATITGESMPAEVGPGAKVYAATLARLGSLRIRATQVGTDTTFARIVKMVEEAEVHRAEVQRLADRFSAYYLPVVVMLAALTLLLRRDPLATAAPVGILAAADTLRSEVPAALAAVRGLGVRHIELLTGDNERTAAALAERLNIRYRANLLPEDKIGIVKEYQARGRTVVMVGDGVNDAPALAQADVGIAMGAAGSDVAIEAAHIVLMREDWTLVPEVFRIARRTMRVVRGNIAFTARHRCLASHLRGGGTISTGSRDPRELVAAPPSALSLRGTRAEVSNLA
jgi:cation transport ATPase